MAQHIAANTAVFGNRFPGEGEAAMSTIPIAPTIRITIGILLGILLGMLLGLALMVATATL